MMKSNTNSSLDLEYGFFGCIFDKPKERIATAIAEGLTHEWFTADDTRICCEAVLRLHQSQSLKELDPLIIMETAKHIAAESNGEKPVAINAEFYDKAIKYRTSRYSADQDSIHDYAIILRNRMIARKAKDRISKYEGIISTTNNPSKTITELCSELQSLMPADTISGRIEVQDLLTGIRSHSERAHSAWLSREEPPTEGVSLPWAIPNSLFGGFKPGGIHIIAARPSVGKTSLVLQMMLSWLEHGYYVGFNCLDMGPNLIMQRPVCNLAMVSTQILNSGKYTEKEEIRLNSAYQKIAQWGNSNHLDICSIYDIHEFRNWCCAKKHAGQLDIAVVDYVQQFRISGPSRSEYEKLTEISAELKSIAITIGIPIVVISQLRRDTAKDGEHRPPSMSDLRGSGALEQDALTLSLLNVNEKVLSGWKTTPPNELIAGFDLDQNRYNQLLHSIRPIEWNLEKNQNGETGIFPMIAFNAYFRWYFGDQDAYFKRDYTTAFTHITQDYPGRILFPDQVQNLAMPLSASSQIQCQDGYDSSPTELPYEDDYMPLDELMTMQETSI